jgi:3-hydroxybutyrate dehydrogenase
MSDSLTQALGPRHAVVTGGGSGIGAAIARALVASGVHVTLMGRDATRLARQAEALNDIGTVHVQGVDVTSPDSVSTAFAAATVQHGAIDILINNAGQAEAAPFAKTDLALWQRMLDVNLTGVFLCTQAVLSSMLERRSGRIVNVASTAGQIGYAYVAAYCAAKHGVIGMTRSLALEVATRGITVNAVCPGYTETELLKQSIGKIVAQTARSEDEAREALLRSNPQRRFVTPEQVANSVLWLCSPGSESITGQTISISGGEVM